MATYPESKAALHNSTDQAIEKFCPKCFASSRNQPIHCISGSHISLPNKKVIGQTPSRGAIDLPVLELQTSTELFKNFDPHRPEPIPRVHERTHQVRFRQNALSPLSPRHLQQFDSSRQDDTGIRTSSASLKPVNGPITPGTVEEAYDPANSEEFLSKNGRSRHCFTVSNIAQKIEQKLFNYGASQNVAKRWLVEIVSWILSALCMVGIIVVLCIYQQRPLPKWPLGITLNAYISLLAKIGSAAILFPVSGALGQLKWNWFQAKDERSKRSKMVWDFE